MDFRCGKGMGRESLLEGPRGSGGSHIDRKSEFNVGRTRKPVCDAEEWVLRMEGQNQSSGQDWSPVLSGLESCPINTTETFLSCPSYL